MTPKIRPTSIPRALLAVLAALPLATTVEAAGKREDHATEAEQSSLSGPPVMAVVSLRRQRIALYDANGGSMRARVSSGQTGYETPVGIYSILQKNRDHYSNIYDDAEMPFMQRITWSGIALHAGALPGYPASHGCVRLPYNFAQQIFDMTKMGLRVVVARDEVVPVEVTHPLLFKPKPVGTVAVATPTAFEPEGGAAPKENPLLPDLRNWPARQKLLDELKTKSVEKAAVSAAATARVNELKPVVKKKTSERAKPAKALRTAQRAKERADERVARAEKALAAAKSDASIKSAEESKTKALAAVAEADAKLAAAQGPAQEAEAALARATQDLAAAETARAAAAAAARDAERRMFPVSVFVSLKTQKLYVRQGYEPVFDTPVTITDPATPIGTHIFTAVDYSNQGDDVRWNVVSIGKRDPGDTDDGSRRKRQRAEDTAGPVVTDAAAAAAALNRVTIPPDVMARVSENVWPGSSLIVSDEEMSKETGKATDFVVLISGEPQGGIKKRPRPRYDPYFFDDYDDDDRYDRRRRDRGGFNPFFSFW